MYDHVAKMSVTKTKTEADPEKRDYDDMDNYMYFLRLPLVTCCRTCSLALLSSVSFEFLRLDFVTDFLATWS